MKVRNIEILQTNSLEWMENKCKEINAGDGVFDCIITDPPYDSLLKWQGVGTTARMGFGRGEDATESNKFFDCIDYQEMYEVFKMLGQLLKNNAHCYIMADHEYMPSILGWARDGDSDFKYSKPLIWDKIDGGMGYHWRGMHEYIVMLEKGKRRLNNLGWGDILRHKRVQNRGHYPTEKPYALIEQLVLNSTKEGDLVFDPFCGSGVLGEVCKRHNRRALLLDKSDRAVTVSLSRIHDGLF